MLITNKLKTRKHKNKTKAYSINFGFYRKYSTDNFLSSWEKLLKNPKVRSSEIDPVILNNAPVYQSVEEYWILDRSIRFVGTRQGYIYLISNNPLQGVFLLKRPTQAYYVLPDRIVGEQYGDEHIILQGRDLKPGTSRKDVVLDVYNKPASVGGRFIRCLYYSFLSIVRTTFKAMFIGSSSHVPIINPGPRRDYKIDPAVFAFSPGSKEINFSLDSYYIPAAEEGINYHRSTEQYSADNGNIHFEGRPGFLCIIDKKELLGFYIQDRPAHIYHIDGAAEGTYVFNYETDSPHLVLKGQIILKNPSRSKIEDLCTIKNDDSPKK